MTSTEYRPKGNATMGDDTPAGDFKPLTQNGVAARFAMAEHQGLRCDARGRTCIRLAEVEFTVRPVVDPGTGAVGDPVTKQACPRHFADFTDHPDEWEYVSIRRFVRMPNGRLRNHNHIQGSTCDDTCTTCARKRGSAA